MALRACGWAIMGNRGEPSFFQRISTFPSGSAAAASVLFFSASLSAGPEEAVFSDVSDVFEDSPHAVRFPSPSFFFCKRLGLVFPLFLTDSKGFFFFAIC